MTYFNALAWHSPEDMGLGGAQDTLGQARLRNENNFMLLLHPPALWSASKDCLCLTEFDQRLHFFNVAHTINFCL
jgi:hypothetical protein